LSTTSNPANSPSALPLQGSADAATSKDEKRARILAATRSLCLRKGFDAARMEEIAAEAQVSKGTLYNYFQSKEDLLIATAVDAHQRHGIDLDALGSPNATARRRLEVLVDALADLFEAISSEMPMSQQIWGVLLRAPEARERFFGSLRQVYEGYRSQITSLLEDADREGSLPAGTDIRLVTTTWIAIFDGLLYRQGFDPDLDGFGSGRSATKAALGWLVKRVFESAPQTRNPPDGETQPPGERQSK